MYVGGYPSSSQWDVCQHTHLDHVEDDGARQTAFAAPAARPVFTETHASCVVQEGSSSIACTSMEEALHQARQLLAMLPSSNASPAPKVAPTAEHQQPLC